MGNARGEMADDFSSFIRMRAPIGAALALALVTVPGVAVAATPLVEINLSPDSTVVLTGVTVEDDEVGEDDLAGGVVASSIPGVPAGIDVVAYDRDSSLHRFVLEITAEVTGGIVATPRDVILCSSTPTCSKTLDGAAKGIPEGTGIDGLSRDGRDLILSFDVPVTLDGTHFEPRDAAIFDGVSFAMFFDGSGEGVPSTADLDGIHRLDSGNLLLSFDVSGTVGGVDFDDEDVLEFDVSGSTWTLVYDGSAEHAGWSAYDADALNAEEPTPTPTPTPTSTSTPTPTPTPTSTSTPTSTPTPTPTPTATVPPPTPTPTPTATPSATPTPGTNLTFVVDTTADGDDCSVASGGADGLCEVCGSGLCTFRAALQESNAIPGPNRIEFGIGGDPLYTIDLGANPVNVTDTLEIDGTSVPPCGDEAIIEIQGDDPVLTIQADTTICGITLK